jgi:hypothetical protein
MHVLNLPANFFPQADRPPSPPRGIASILNSDELTSDFGSFLADIDAENEDSVQTNRLSFALFCRSLRQGSILQKLHFGQKLFRINFHPQTLDKTQPQTKYLTII